MIEKNFKEKKQILPISINIKRGRQINNKRSEINNNKKNNRKNLIMNKKIIPIQNNIKIKINSKEKRKNKKNINTSNFSSDNESYSSSKERRKRFYNEDSLNCLTKNDEGICSNEEEEIDSNLKENLENNIQEILIEIYYKYFIRDKYKNKLNIKKKKEIEKKKNELKLSFRQYNKQYNFYCLKILSKKIKEILYHYREKLFDNNYLSPIYSSFKKKKNEISNIKLQENYQEFSIDNNNKQIMSQTTSTSSYQSDSYILSQINQLNCNKHFFSSILIQITKSIQEYHLSDKIINELIHIKSSLKKAVIEIKDIFQYPLSLLEKKFSIECIQLEAFNIILIKFDLLSTILYHIRQYKRNHKYKIDLEYLNDLENDKKYERKEMTKFDKLIKEKLVNFDNSDNEDDQNKYKDKIDIDSNYYDDSIDINNNSKIIQNDNKNFNNNILSPISLSDSENNNNKNNINENSKNDNSEEENNKLNDLDIDELVKFIDIDENNHKNKRKKKNKNKGKKNKKLFININNIDTNNNSIEKNEEIERKNFEKIYEDFKKDITNNSYEFIPLKIKPKLSANWLMTLYINNKIKNSK